MRVSRSLAVLLLSLSCSLSCHLLRAPKRGEPRLSAGVHVRMMASQGLERSYLLYVPKRSAPKPPLIVLLHGSRQTAQDLRVATGYAFDRLADQHGFIAVYPEGHGRRWNDCRARGRFAARKLNLDDVGYLLALVDRLEESAGIDRARVFFAGYSNGGQLAFRMALERPERVTGIAVFAANLPSDENWLCQRGDQPVPALLINGTADRINPFEGGRVSVFGFASRGTVRSALASAEYFAQLAGLSASEHSETGADSDAWLERFHWRGAGAAEVELIAVHGGGHVIPGPHTAFPRILGKVSTAIDGPEEVWRFFARQAARGSPGDP